MRTEINPTVPHSDVRIRVFLFIGFLDVFF